MKRLMQGFAMLLLALGLTGFVAASDVAPDALVKSVTDDVIKSLQGDKALQAGDRKRVESLVEAKVLPNFNFQRMTQMAMAREWRQATPAQQQQLIQEFRTLLVRTYSTALMTYRNQTVDVKPLKAAPTDTDVLVRTEIRESGRKPMQVDYALQKEAAGWKVYDVIVGGISLVTNYRDEFSQQVRSVGVDGLIKSLQAKNAGAAQETTVRK